MYRFLLRLLQSFICLLISIQCGFAQEMAAGSTLKEVLQLAETNYPLLKSKAWEVKAAQKGTNVSKGTLIPSLAAAYQVNCATFSKK